MESPACTTDARDAELAEIIFSPHPNVRVWLISVAVLDDDLAMRAYHIRITLFPPSSSSGPSSATTSTSYKQRSHVSSHSTSSGGAPFVPTSLFQPLPSNPPRYAARRNTLSVYGIPSAGSDKSASERACKDYRLGPIHVDWVDFSRMDTPGASFIKVGSGKERERSAQRKGPSFR